SVDELPSLLARNRFGVVVGPSVEKNEVVETGLNLRISGSVFIQGFHDALVDRDLMALPPLFFFDPEPRLDPAILIDEVADSKLQQVRDSQCRVDAQHKQQQVAVAPLAP